MKLFGLIVEKRPSVPRWLNLLSPILAVLLALLATGGLLFAIGVNPLFAFKEMFFGVFRSINSISEVLIKATPLLLVSLGLSIAFSSLVINLGAEGQLWMGAIAATWIGITFTGVPAVLLLPLIIVASFLAGALWAVIPGIFKAKYGINEIIFTLMMNSIAVLFAVFLFEGPLKDVSETYVAQTPLITPAAWLPKLIPGTRFHAGILIAFLAVFLIYILMFKTPLGYQIRAVGRGRKAAQYGGISVPKNIIIVMILSGGLAGLAGMGEICGVHHRMLAGISGNYGFTAIAVTNLGRRHPLGVIPASIFFAGLLVGLDTLQRSVGTSPALGMVIVALVIFFVLMADALIRYRIRRE